MVDCVVISGDEMPRLVFEHPGRRRVDVTALRQELGTSRQALVLALIDPVRTGDKRQYRLGADVEGGDA